MRKVTKKDDSQILEQNLKYIPKNSNNNTKISDILYNEQKGFCSYTDEFITITDARDIEHFNPTLKGSNEDNYQNWFLVKRQWNSKKGNKWQEVQPILHPTAVDFEERITYSNGDYFAKSESDISANNLVKLLDLDNLALANKRKRYIARIRKEIEAYDKTIRKFFIILLKEDYCRISYPRALKEEFGIDILEDL